MKKAYDGTGVCFVVRGESQSAKIKNQKLLLLMTVFLRCSCTYYTILIGCISFSKTVLLYIKMVPTMHNGALAIN